MIIGFIASIIAAFAAVESPQSADTAPRVEVITPAAGDVPASNSRTEVPEGNYMIGGDEIRCKYIRPIDSRIPKKICQSVAEWEARKKMQEDEMRSGKNSNSTCASEGPC